MRQLLSGAALILTALVLAPAANAEPGAYSHEDEDFYRTLSEGTENIAPMVLTNPPLVRAQALQACQRMDEGVKTLDTVYMLMNEGPYSWDVA
jgi:hypothetical protein